MDCAKLKPRFNPFLMISTSSGCIVLAGSIKKCALPTGWCASRFSCTKKRVVCGKANYYTRFLSFGYCCCSLAQSRYHFRQAFDDSLAHGSSSLGRQRFSVTHQLQLILKASISYIGRPIIFLDLKQIR